MRRVTGSRPTSTGSREGSTGPPRPAAGAGSHPRRGPWRARRCPRRARLAWSAWRRPSSRRHRRTGEREGDRNRVLFFLHRGKKAREFLLQALGPTRRSDRDHPPPSRSCSIHRSSGPLMMFHSSTDSASAAAVISQSANGTPPRTRSRSYMLWLRPVVVPHGADSGQRDLNAGSHPLLFCTPLRHEAKCVDWHRRLSRPERAHRQDPLLRARPAPKRPVPRPDARGPFWSCVRTAKARAESARIGPRALCVARWACASQ